MGVQIWKDAAIFVDDLSAAGTVKAFNLSTSVAELDVTPISTTGWTSVVGGLKSGTVSLELMSDFADGGQDPTLWPLLGSPTVPHSIATASADGSVAYTFHGIPLNYAQLDGSVGDLSMGRLAGASASSPVVRGRLLHPETARTSSGSGTGRQLGAVAAGKSLFAALHVVAASGSSPTLDVKVQSDDNAGFTSATDRITFSQATGKTSAWSSVAGAITDDYWRITYTVGGSTPSFTLVVVAGII